MLYVRVPYGIEMNFSLLHTCSQYDSNMSKFLKGQTSVIIFYSSTPLYTLYNSI